MTSVKTNKIMLVSRKWPLRGKFTSVERFLDYFEGFRIITSSIINPKPYFLWKHLSNKANRKPYSSWSAFLEAKAILAILLYRPVIVHFMYGDHDLFYTLKLAKLLGIKISATFYFSVNELSKKIPDKSYFTNIDLVFATGKYQKSYLEKFIKKENIYLLPLGVDTDFFSPSGKIVNSISNPKILQVGKNRRDWKLAKSVFLQLKELFPLLTVNMVGCYEKRTFFKKYDWIIFHPVINDNQLRFLYRESAILLLPLEDGGSSNSLNEALACGVPVVTNNVPNLIDYTDSDCVHMGKPGDSESMVKACSKLLNNPEYRNEKCLATRAHALKFSWPKIRSIFLQSYLNRFNIEVIP